MVLGLAEPLSWILSHPFTISRMVLMSFLAYCFWKLWCEQDDEDDDDGGGGIRMLRYLGLAEDPADDTRWSEMHTRQPALAPPFV